VKNLYTLIGCSNILIEQSTALQKKRVPKSIKQTYFRESDPHCWSNNSICLATTVYTNCFKSKGPCFVLLNINAISVFILHTAKYTKLLIWYLVTPES